MQCVKKNLNVKKFELPQHVRGKIKGEGNGFKYSIVLMYAICNFQGESQKIRNSAYKLQSKTIKIYVFLHHAKEKQDKWKTQKKQISI